MSQVIMIGCDLHQRSMLLRYSVGAGQPQQLSYDTDTSGRRRMISRLQSLAKKNKATRIVFAYEASEAGFGLSDELDEAGIECHVLSPTNLPSTPKTRKQKTDARDAQMILEQVRGHILAGNDLPVVWTPPQRLRDDRELIRSRIDVADEMTRVKHKVRSLFKRYEITFLGFTKFPWTNKSIQYLRKEVIPTLDPLVGLKLKMLLDRYDLFDAELAAFDKAILRLAKTDRYKAAYSELRTLPGVGPLVAMAFLTEMGDLGRFRNRREVAAYLGLCPSSHESGETDDRKGRITRQGPARLRKVLCQAVWVSLQRCDASADAYHRIRQDQKHRTKKAIVALMRKLAIKMWHVGSRHPVSPALVGRGGPHSTTSAQAQQRDMSSPSPLPSLRPQGYAG